MRAMVFMASLLTIICPLTRSAGASDQVISAQKEAMNRLAFLDGVWRGSAWAQLPEGRHEMTQTERVGPFLGGSVKVIEGRGYDADGTVSFNALGVISFDAASGAYKLRSYAMGYAGDFPLQLTMSGYIWEAPAGPGALTRYTATFQNGTWREIGERISNGESVQVFEMNLRRVADTDWPAANAVPMR